MTPDELKHVIKQWREITKKAQSEVLKPLIDEIDRIDKRLVALRPQGDVVLIKELEILRSRAALAVSVLIGLAKG
jgi:hypothetical protein